MSRSAGELRLGVKLTAKQQPVWVNAVIKALINSAG